MADLRSGAEALPQVPRVAMSAEAVATDINRQGTAIGNTQVAQNRSLPPEEWTGAAADAASSEIQNSARRPLLCQRRSRQRQPRLMSGLAR